MFDKELIMFCLEIVSGERFADGISVADAKSRIVEEYEKLGNMYQSTTDMWKRLMDSVCDELADLAGLPKDPCPGWQPCIEKIKTMIK